LFKKDQHIDLAMTTFYVTYGCY